MRQLKAVVLACGCMLSSNGWAQEVVGCHYRGGGWGPCKDESRSGGVRIIMGPPQIVWVRPSTEGSQMGAFDNLDARAAQQLSAITETSYQLVIKAKSALRRGDLDAAERFFLAADAAGPDSRDRADIQAGLSELRSLRQEHFRASVRFDQGPPSAGITKFVKSPPRQIRIEVPQRHQNNPDLQRLIREEAETYGNFLRAAETLQRTQVAMENGRASQAEVSKALESYSSAIDKVAEKRDEIVQKIYVLD